MPAFSISRHLITMIEAVVAVRNAACGTFPEEETFTLEQVTNLVTMYTKIDTVEFVRYDADVSNPIWGEFYRWNRFVPYRGQEEVVEIRYASHLDLAWLRFVICKELCHALDNRKGTHTVSGHAVTNLIAVLSLISSTSTGALTAPVQAEKLAEAAAMELLVPLPVRKRLLASGEYAALGVAGIAARLQVPDMYVSMVFDPGYMSIAETLFA